MAKNNKVEEVKVKEVNESPDPKPEFKGNRVLYTLEDGTTTTTEPKAESKKEAKKPTLKEMYADLFAKVKLHQTGKEFKGDPSAEATQGHPLLVKYHQNWLNAAE